MANRNWASGGKIYSMHVKPVLLDCNFIVDSTNGNGLGIRSLKGPCIQNVFMHTSATPAAGNPNPAPGTIVVRLADNYNRLFSGFSAIVSPLSGSPLQIDSVSAALTPGVAYTITTLGNATPAQWLALGVPAGVTPAVGVSFIALVSGSGAASTARVMATAAAGSGIDHVEQVGDANLSLAPNRLVQPGFGAQIILECYKNGVKTAPANGSVISLAFYLSDSSVLIQGE